MAKCSVDGCEASAYGKGLCNTHYQRVRKGRGINGEVPCKHCGNLFIRAPSSGQKYCSIACRFLSEKRWVLSGDCMEWAGHINKETGYGMISESCEGRSIPIGAHRVAWAAKNGEIPDGASVLHSCDNRRCVNPDHLFLGSQADNMHDMIRKGRARHVSAAIHWTKKHPDKIKRGREHHLHKDSSCLPRGAEHHNAKLTDKDALAILSSPMTLAELSRMYGVSQSTISLIRRRKAWRHVTSQEA